MAIFNLNFSTTLRNRSDMVKGYDRSVDNFIRIYKERGLSWN